MERNREVKITTVQTGCWKAGHREASQRCRPAWGAGRLSDPCWLGGNAAPQTFPGPCQTPAALLAAAGRPENVTYSGRLLKCAPSPSLFFLR